MEMGGSGNVEVGVRSGIGGVTVVEGELSGRLTGLKKTRELKELPT
jgi:hypothetical protein